MELVRRRPRSGGKSSQAEGPAAIAQLRAARRKRVAAIRKLNARYAGQALPSVRPRGGTGSGASSTRLRNSSRSCESAASSIIAQPDGPAQHGRAATRTST